MIFDFVELVRFGHLGRISIGDSRAKVMGELGEPSSWFGGPPDWFHRMVSYIWCYGIGLNFIFDGEFCIERIGLEVSIAHGDPNHFESLEPLVPTNPRLTYFQLEAFISLLNSHSIPYEIERGRHSKIRFAPDIEAAFTDQTRNVGEERSLTQQQLRNFSIGSRLGPTNEMPNEVIANDLYVARDGTHHKIIDLGGLGLDRNLHIEIQGERMSIPIAFVAKRGDILKVRRENGELVILHFDQC